MAELMSAAELKHEAAPHYHVFSVRPRITGNGSEDISELNTKTYVTRKSHRKSRCGCIPCKTKRVKCDEHRPVCGRCERTKSHCSYEPETQSSKKTVKSMDKKPTSQESSEATSTTPRPIRLATPRLFEQSDPDLRLLKHYDIVTGTDRDTVTCSDMLVGSHAEQYRIKVLRLAQEHTYLLHAILSVAALHLDHFEIPGYRIPKLKHLQVALSDFQSAINKPITKNEADAILLTSMMINMQYFSYVDSTDPKDSWVFSGEPGRLCWLQMQMGLLPLIIGTEKFHAESMLNPIWIQAAYDMDESKGLPLELLRLCKVHPDMSESQTRASPYFNVLRLVAPLMLIERGPTSLVKLLKCIAGFDKSFYALLQSNDHAALLIMGFWFGMMCYVDFWWNEKRCFRDCTAICMYLDANGNEVVRSLLEFPASACGYSLKGAAGHVLPVEDATVEVVDPALLNMTE